MACGRLQCPPLSCDDICQLLLFACVWVWDISCYIHVYMCVQIDGEKGTFRKFLLMLMSDSCAQIR